MLAARSQLSNNLGNMLAYLGLTTLAGSKGFLQCFDTVGLVIWPVKIVPEMTYNVLSGMLSLYITTTSTAMDKRRCMQSHHKVKVHRTMSV